MICIFVVVIGGALAALLLLAQVSCLYIYAYIYTDTQKKYIYIYYIYITYICMHVCVYIYIYIDISALPRAPADRPSPPIRPPLLALQLLYFIFSQDQLPSHLLLASSLTFNPTRLFFTGVLCA